MSLKEVLAMAWPALLTCLLAGCALHKPLSPPPYPSAISDLKNLKQDCAAYLAPSTAGKGLMTSEQQAQRYADFRRRFFAPWEGGGDDAACDEAQQLFDRYTKDGGFGENLRRHNPSWARGMARQADLEHFPNCNRPAITIRNTNLRDLPTLSPRFEKLRGPGEGYPFDSLQNSALWANTPLWACHVTRDGSWVLAKTALGNGWIPAADIAFVDSDFMAAWQDKPLAALVRDNVSIRDTAGVFRFKTHVGAVFPLAGATRDKLQCLIAVADVDGNAVARDVKISGNDAVAMPLELYPLNIATVAGRMLGQPYGWGGLYEDRDCSAAIRDIFAPFGIFLPRNSSQQAKAGKVINLKDLPPAQREQAILKQGIPWLTLVRCPGHIMLYIGSRDGRALILHSFWGIKVRNTAGKPDERVVGFCAITTLQPGIDLPNISLPEGDLRNSIESSVLIGEEYKE